MSSTFPGATRPSREADDCPCQYDDCAEVATQEYCTEVDSMGGEWLPLCDAHIEQFKEDVANANALSDGECEWCKARDVQVAPFRDWQEGTQGPMYDVCETCRGKSIDEANKLADNVPEDEEDINGDVDTFAQMPELDDDAIGEMFFAPGVGRSADYDCDELNLFKHSNIGEPIRSDHHFNLNGPVLVDGQLGFSAHFQDGIHFVIALDLDLGMMFWGVSFDNPLYFIAIGPRVNRIRLRLAALGYRVLDTEEL